MFYLATMLVLGMFGGVLIKKAPSCKRRGPGFKILTADC